MAPPLWEARRPRAAWCPSDALFDVGSGEARADGIRRMQVTVNAGDVTKGAKIFKTKCAQCHNADQVSAPACSPLDPTTMLDTARGSWPS